MYARFFSFKSTPEQRGAIEKIADETYRYTKTLHGFLSAAYLISEDETQYGSFSLWKTREDAEHAGTAIHERLVPEIQKLASSPPEVNILEVYEPRS